MTKHPFSPSASSIYPGEFIPLPEAGAMMASAERKGNAYPPKFSVNMRRGEDCIVIESALAGCHREDIYISGYDNLLSIYVLHHPKDHSSERIQLHEIYDEECMQRLVLLPGNTDPEFGSASYQNGILSISIPVSKHPLPQKDFRIMVY